jgi:lysozyme family protein
MMEVKMTAFDAAFDFTVGQEGAWSVDQNDHGDWTGGVVGVGILRGTAWGISAASYPSIDIKSLTKDQAKAIYLRDYWNACHCDNFAPALALLVFDCAVNGGVGTADRALQTALNVTVDGIVGPKTLAAASSCDTVATCIAFQAARLRFQVNTSQWPRYADNWSHRLIAATVAACKLL